MFDLTQDALRTGGKCFEEIIVSDVDIRKLKQKLDVSEEIAKSIVQKSEVLNLTINKKMFIVACNLMKKMEVKEYNEKNKNKTDFIEKQYKEVSDDDLEELGYFEKGKFFLKEPNLAEIFDINEKASNENEKTAYNFYQGIYYLLKCAYKLDENKNKVLAFSVSHKKQLMSGNGNNPYVLRALYEYKNFSNKRDYVGLEKN